MKPTQADGAKELEVARQIERSCFDEGGYDTHKAAPLICTAINEATADLRTQLDEAQSAYDFHYALSTRIFDHLLERGIIKDKHIGPEDENSSDAAALAYINAVDEICAQLADAQKQLVAYPDLIQACRVYMYSLRTGQSLHAIVGQVVCALEKAGIDPNTGATRQPTQDKGE